MKNPNLQGKRYISLVRCSTVSQADTSIEDQLVVIAAYAREHEMVHVDDVMLEGVSGSIPGNRSDIEQLIERKHQRDEFDVVLVQDTTRLTRGGPKHGAKIEYDLESAGIEVAFVTDNLPEGDFGDIYKSILYYAGKQQAKSISMTSARGSMSSIEQGRSAHCKRPPYGVDRLFLSPDGTANHIIQNLPDGTQLKLDPETGQVLGRFGRNEARGIPRHYIKQKDEKIALIPGADEQVSVVRRIYRRYHVDNWGYYRIAQELNDEGIPSPSGKHWSVGGIRNILLNPIYTGLGIANRHTNAIYHMRSPEAPTPVHIAPQTLNAGKRPPARIRPRSDWHEREVPHLEKFLDDGVRKLAVAKQQAHLDDQAIGRIPSVNKDRHRDSSFILKDILISRQAGCPMTGRRTGRKGAQRRYYAVSKAFSAPQGDTTLRKMIPAEPLEQAVLGMLRMVLQKDPTLPQTIAKTVERVRQESAGDHNALDDLLTKRESVARKLEFIVDELDDLGKDAVKEKAGRYQSQLRALDQQISQAERGSTSQFEGIDADGILDRLRHLGESLEDLPAVALRRLLKAFVARLEVTDLANRQVEIELRLPSWAMEDGKPMCLDSTFAWKHDNEAHTNYMLLVGVRLMWWQPFESYVVFDFGQAA